MSLKSDHRNRRPSLTEISLLDYLFWYILNFKNNNPSEIPEQKFEEKFSNPEVGFLTLKGYFLKEFKDFMEEELSPEMEEEEELYQEMGEELYQEEERILRVIAKNISSNPRGFYVNASFIVGKRSPKFLPLLLALLEE